MSVPECVRHLAVVGWSEHRGLIPLSPRWQAKKIQIDDFDIALIDMIQDSPFPYPIH